VTKKKPESVDPDMEPASILAYFSKIADPRVTRARLHPLSSVLVLALCGVVCGANSFVEIELFGKSREKWLRSFLDLPHGIPSHDTLGRVFAMLNPKELQRAFVEWTKAISTVTSGEVVAIDGKTLRRSFEKAGERAFVHMVSAWSAGNQLVLGQVRTDAKSNEITAIPRLLELLELTGCLVTIDAMGCQKEIAQKIIDSNADYMLAVKDNQPKLAADVAAVFDEAMCDESFKAKCHETREKGHGRVDVRRCWTLKIDPDFGAPYDQWPKLAKIVRVETERTVNGKTSIEHRHYITSRATINAKAALAASRSHWGIENQLHWVLDVAFREDECRVRVQNAGENFAVIRHIALNLIKSTRSGVKKYDAVGIKAKRRLAGWDDDYMLRVLGANSQQI
jgi:predicted transposase YbfD/YdcC